MGFMRKKPLDKKRRRPSSSSSKALANKLPAVENKHTTERGHRVTYELRPTLCGKPNCRRHHGPYWYAYWTQGGKVRSVYIGKIFRKVEDKCPERFRLGERFQ
jgi:hypothetical protein